MKTQFEKLFTYNKEMNQRLLDLISKNLNQVNEKTILLINHIINAHQIWNARINNQASFEVWQTRIFSDLVEINESNFENTMQIIDNRNLEELISYSNSKGEIFSNTIDDVIFHVINHSTYHRAQIITDLKIAQIEPANTDYIFYRRK
ncbi:damage-inducible protein DinB [Paenimyroides tangerinum]|uniref:Damage-inducible protein DinB n=1 Tax=Paenimyroides tangerinum TaxID=2488728 RepID=A0A3P3W8N0_9FLAO|nr:DinB family protein [Paenimyroides tangerinum]RRJ90356.1 damage-inducible protein DinB [Paenimyroides tangerinum]